MNNNNCKVLKGRKVILYPDLNCFEKWNEKAKTLANVTGFKVSQLLELKAIKEHKAQGLDLADFLVNFNEPF